MDWVSLVSPTLEMLWVLGLFILTVMMVFKKKAFIVILGGFLITYACVSLLRESVLSFQEIDILKWILRIGISLLVFDSVVGAPKSNPIDRIASTIRRVIDRCTRKELE